MSRWLYEVKRVLMVAKKPSQEEFKEVSRVTGLGVLIIGLIGFLMMAISYLIEGSV